MSFQDLLVNAVQTWDSTTWVLQLLLRCLLVILTCLHLGEAYLCILGQVYLITVDGSNKSFGIVGGASSDMKSAQAILLHSGMLGGL